MIRRIVLENFMAHQRTEIEPARGLTVLVGPNNCGKSAVLEALRTLCGNARGDYMVRHGTKECRVAVETDEGHLLEWRRKGGTVSYCVDGREVHRGMPAEFQDLLRLPNVTSADGKDSFEIHFGPQKEPLFLLDCSGRQSATFFASSSDAALMMEMQQRYRQKVGERRRDEARLEREAELWRAQQASLEPVGRIEGELAAAEGAYAALIESLAIQAQLEQTLRALETQERRIQQAEARHRALLPLAEPPALADVAPLEALCRQLADEAARAGKAQARIAALDPLQVPPEQEDIAPLEQLVSRLAAAWKNETVAGRRVGLLQVLAEPPSVGDPAPLARAIEQLVAATGDVKTRTVEVASLGAQLQDARQAIEQWAADHPACPVCGGIVDPARLICEGGHEHERA